MTNIFKNRQNLICFIKYGLVGTSGAVIDLGLLYLLVEFLNFNPVVAGSISFILAVVNNFYWNKIWTFENTSKDYGKQFGKFLLVSLVGLGLTAILMYLGVEVLNWWYILVKVSVILIVLIWNFVANYWWTFRSLNIDKSPKNDML